MSKDKNSNRNLSQMVSDLFVKSKGGNDLSSRIQRLREEIGKVTDSDDAIFGKLRGLLDSFHEIIPDEKQRYHAAIKALSTTSKLSQQEIVKAVNHQLEELRILEKSLLPTLPDWRSEIKSMEAKSKAIRDEIAKLRDKIVQMEKDDQEILKGMESKEKETEVIEKALKNLFSDMGSEIGAIKNKIEDFTAEKPAAQPTPVPAKAPAKKESSTEKAPAAAAAQPAAGESQKSGLPAQIKEVKEAAEIIIASNQPQEDSEWQKKCPMCGGRMNYHTVDKLWLCYSCAYEEASADGPGKSEAKNGTAAASKPAPSSDEIFGSPEPEEPASSSASGLYEESTTGSQNGQVWTKSKPCPACKKTMHWYPAAKAWRCPACYYERRI
ncbi:MAG: hypothetical protein M0042_00635 [Nitrospiraceae bacterium]|nr:hypothetical protein [Nitrospiraceae bacterium]